MFLTTFTTQSHKMERSYFIVAVTVVTSPPAAASLAQERELAHVSGTIQRDAKAAGPVPKDQNPSQMPRNGRKWRSFLEEIKRFSL